MKRQKLNSRRTAALLASTLVLSQAEPILALADVKVETAAETVTDENTVVITSVDDLVQMSKNCVSESYSKGKTFVLTQDISLDGSDFQPIAVFAGNFQGNGRLRSKPPFLRFQSNSTYGHSCFALFSAYFLSRNTGSAG